MSVSPHRVWSFHAMNVVVLAALLIAGACHRAQSTVGQPSKSTDDRGIPRFAGVDIVPTSHAGFLVRVHSGMVSPGEPLYVIDGAPMKIPTNRGIDWFKPEDIADIKVLKFPHELVEYGPNGANGVILITTRQNPGQSRKR